ncbi:MAG: RNHCP domain-containing protein [Phycisphaerales bacterium JB043]
MASRKGRRGSRGANASGGFVCVRCGAHVSGSAYGTKHRNHCPVCLWSRHVDEYVGDRRASCRSGMEPIGVEVRPDGEWALIHRCTGCGVLRTNRVAGDDDVLKLVGLALRAVQNLPFPLK